MKRIAELPRPAAGDDADDRRVPLGAWLVGTLPPVAVGAPALTDAPGRDELPWLIGAVPAAVLGDFAPVNEAVPTTTTEPATTAMTTAAQAPRRANNRRPRIITFRLPVTAERDDRRLSRAWTWPPARYAADDVGGRRTCLCSLSAGASDPTTWPDNAKWP